MARFRTFRKKEAVARSAPTGFGGLSALVLSSSCETVRVIDGEQIEKTLNKLAETFAKAAVNTAVLAAKQAILPGS